MRCRKLRARFLLKCITVITALSCITSLASYFYYQRPFTLDAEFVYRGWPLCWLIESWSYWTGPPYPSQVSFQPANFIIDYIFYAIVLQMPSLLYMYAREIRKKTVDQQSLQFHE